MTHVHVILTGLVALLTSRVAGPPVALLVDASGPSVASDGTMIPPHVATLRIAAERVSGERTADSVETIGGVPTAVFVLHHEHVGFNGPLLDRDLLLVDGVPENDETSTAANARYLHWLPRAAELWGGERSKEIPAASIDLGRGTLSAFRVMPELWQFRRGDAVIRQQVADAAELTFDVSGDFDIVFSRLSGDTPAPLHVRTGGADAITITVSNTPTHQMEHSAADLQRHFELYGRLFSKGTQEPSITIFPAVVERGRASARTRVANELGVPRCVPLVQY